MGDLLINGCGLVGLVLILSSLALAKRRRVRDAMQLKAALRDAQEGLHGLMLDPADGRALVGAMEAVEVATGNVDRELVRALPSGSPRVRRGGSVLAAIAFVGAVAGVGIAGTTTTATQLAQPDEPGGSVLYPGLTSTPLHPVLGESPAAPPSSALYPASAGCVVTPLHPSC